MKIRNGFVANSSSTSFCIFGIELENSRGGRKKFREDFTISENMFSDIISFLEKKTDLEVYVDEYWYIGKSLSKMRDDETFGDFKNSVKEQLRLVFTEEAVEKANVIEESWCDG